jgi:hypothetical protein
MNQMAIKDRRAVQDISAIQPARSGGPAETFLLALRSGATVEEAERVGEMLLRFQEKEEAREAERAFNAAFAKAMTAMPPIPKDGHADRKGAGSFSYSKLETILGKAQPVLGEHGLHLGFGVTRSDDGKGITVTAIVRHEGGHSIAESLSSQIATFSSANTFLQNQEGTVTALKRTLSMSILGLAVGGEEEEAPYTNRAKAVTAEQFQAIQRLMDDLHATPADEEKLLAYLGINDLHDMDEGHFRRAERALNKKLREKREGARA